MIVLAIVRAQVTMSRQEFRYPLLFGWASEMIDKMEGTQLVAHILHDGPCSRY